MSGYLPDGALLRTPALSTFRYRRMTIDSPPMLIIANNTSVVIGRRSKRL